LLQVIFVMIEHNREDVQKVRKFLAILWTFKYSKMESTISYRMT
jgi:hypothetical protein